MIVKCLLLSTLFTFISADFDSYESGMTCSLPRFDHGKLRTRQRYRLYRFVCYPRYILVGNRYATCRNGEWDVPWPVCVKPGCVAPVVEHSLRSSSHSGAWLTFFCLPGYELVGSSNMYCDGKSWNGTAPTCVDTNVASKLSCDFENEDLCGWKDDELHDFDWKRLNLNTPSAFLLTGPSYDHTLGKGASGYYMYIESTSRMENDTARLISPVYRRELTKGGCFKFFYHMFGKDTGGLRVYQKPDNFALESLLRLSDSDKQTYILFEQWGNQGDVWYGSVSPLKDLADDFQIVIEGIRGRSFTSDIAIDDVAIMQGENCTKAVVPTPPTFASESCEGRCNVFVNPGVERGCGCTVACVTDGKCCADFFELCIFSSATDTSLSDDDKSSSAELPQTQKLVSTTVTTSEKPTTEVRRTTKQAKSTVIIDNTVTKTTLTTMRTIVPPKTTSTTHKPTTPAKPTTISKLTTFITTLKTKPTTTRRVASTTKSSTIITSTKKPIITTTVRPSTFTIKRTTYVPVTAKRQMDDAASRTIQDKSKHEWSALKTWTVIMAVTLCFIGSGWIIYASRGARGMAVMARLRGRTQHDPEVRYLHANVDDE
ncbi:scavenger receptor type C [Aphomia sociella]